MDKYFTAQDFTIFDSVGEPSIVQRITKLEWASGSLYAHHGLEDSNSDTSDTPTQAFPFNPKPKKILNGETDSDGRELFDYRAGDPWDSSGEAFNYVEKKLGLI
jgi:hypothetical protein